MCNSMKIILVSALAAILVLGCGSDDTQEIDGGTDAGTDTDTDADTDTDTDSDTDTDTDTDTTPAGDYWDDGYCGDYGNNVPASMDCNGVPGLVPGCCDADGKTLWCESNMLWCVDCVDGGIICTWLAESDWYDCVDESEPMEDPSGTAPYYCDGTPLHEPDAGTDAGGDAG